ncbi:type IX secretion system motor protein PorM/GldM [Formosa algae]|uniref:Gliding motility-associated protein GldM n=1 Tax=Formosa algae TaxID=225843 RepID=A0A9X0YJS8_9FLAO|nr:gliding motility protein GldM [Formosa algae]MBP1838176.1 gliding motility-associated protein GldM [Formosa algae]MDQ0334311.1 gliding motility-associated protein GldM [Formosa algae]OEI80737.1 gliding motility protein GldM [Formosa algae]PNW29886.1 gliding motility protein GldM [Formosa algae]
MAGGNLSARQKMINLMYLIFIAMLALNMSKEVLSAFGLMNEKLVESNQLATGRNQALLSNLAVKADENPEKFKSLKQKADKIGSLGNDLNSYLEDLKSKMTADLDDATDYETMDKGDFLDNHFFQGDSHKEEGEKFLSEIAKFRDQTVAILESDPKLAPMAADVKKKFSTDEVENRDGIKVDWLEYNYKGYPLVASLTKVTQLQSDVKTTASEVLNNMLAGSLAADASMTNYTTLLETSKSAYFNGETFDGNIVLGRKDGSTKPNKVELTLDGRPLTAEQYTVEDGKVKLNFGTGSAGEHVIEGKLTFLQDGESVEVPVKSTFATISKPNAATISADKMNVVYRGVANPMTITFAGIADSKVVATGSGLRKGTGSGKYIMNPGTGREVTINVSGTLPDGNKVSDKATFRIKDIPSPTGTIRGESGNVSMQRNSLSSATIGAQLEDFDFDLPLKVTSFKIKIPGQPTITVGGTRLNSRAEAALRKAKRGESVTIFDISAQINGNSSYKLKKVSPIIIELSN